MAFRVKDLMISVVPGDGDPECSCGVASKLDPAAARCGAGTYCSCTVETKGMALNQECEGVSYPQCSCGVATAAATPPGNLTTITTVTTVTTVTTIVQGGHSTGLKELMEQLRRVLDEVERQEREPGAPAGLPATKEESEDLERRLSEAIGELQAHRKSLQKPAAPARKGRKDKK